MKRRMHRRTFAKLSILMMSAFMLDMLVAEIGAAAKSPDPSVTIVFTQRETEVTRSSVQSDDDSGGRCRIAMVRTNDTADSFRVLTEGFHSACDPCISFDGTRILFAARKTASDRWDIWEMDREGGELRQLTTSMGDCREPIYLATSSITPPLFIDRVRWVLFTSTAADTSSEDCPGPTTSLYVMNIEPIVGRGTVIWRTTYSPGCDFSPTALRDGRVLFSSRQDHGGRTESERRVKLMALNWAGTGLNLFFTSPDAGRMLTMASETSDRRLVFVESDTGDPAAGGRLATVSFARPLNSHRLLTDVEAGVFLTPEELSTDTLIAARRHDASTFGLVLLDSHRGTVLKTLFDDPRRDDFDPQVLRSVEEPMGRITTVVDSSTMGSLQCLNVYDSTEPEMKSLAEGDVVSVRFIEGIPASIGSPAPRGTGVLTRIIGHAPVEYDGSFLVDIIPDTPFCIQLLDKNDVVLKTMTNWMWVRQGTRRGCIGCHENKELAPENRATMALVKAKPTSLMNGPAERRMVVFDRDIAPIIRQRCTGCHAATVAEDPRPVLVVDTPTEMVRTRDVLLGIGGPRDDGEGRGTTCFVLPWHATKSPLVILLRGGPYSSSGPTVPPHTVLSDREMSTFIQWIDLGCPYSRGEEGLK